MAASCLLSIMLLSQYQIVYQLSELKNGFSRRWTPERKTFRDVKFTAYDLRHTFCTMLYDAGVDIKTAMAWMGHSDAQVTLNIYTHLSRTRKSLSTADFESFSASLIPFVGKSVGKDEKAGEQILEIP